MYMHNEGHTESVKSFQPCHTGKNNQAVDIYQFGFLGKQARYGFIGLWSEHRVVTDQYYKINIKKIHRTEFHK